MNLLWKNNNLTFHGWQEHTSVISSFEASLLSISQQTLYEVPLQKIYFKTTYDCKDYHCYNGKINQGAAILGKSKCAHVIEENTNH